MQAARNLAALALLAALAAACAQGPSRQAAWYTASGAPADDEAVRAAVKLCEPRVAAPSRGGLYRGTVEWGIAMLDCLHGEGFVLVYEDPEQISPADDAPAAAPPAS